MHKEVENGQAFTIKHLDEAEPLGDQRIPHKPFLGRMNLSESLNPLKGFEKMFN